MSYVALGAVVTGASTAVSAGKGVADAYTYGAASAAIEQGQAMQAWAELEKKQNTPAITNYVGKGAGCPSSFVLSPTDKNPPYGATCVNAQAVHIEVVTDKEACGSSPNWPWCNALVLYLQLHYPANAHGGSLSALREVVLKSLQALSAWTWGWKNVKGALLAVARYRVPSGDADDETMAALEKPAGDWYDAAVAKAKAAPQTPQYLNPNLLAAFSTQAAPKTTTTTAASTAAPKAGLLSAPAKGSHIALVAIAVALGIGGMFAYKKGYHKRLMKMRAHA